MAGEDLYGLLYGDEPTAQESARAMAAALRGQREAAGNSQAMGMLASMGQNPVLSQLAPAAFRASEQDSQASGQLGQQLLSALGRKAEMERNGVLADFHRGEIENRSRANDLREEGLGRQKIFNGKNGETLAFNPLSGEATTLRQAPPRAPGGGMGVAPMGFQQEDIDHLAAEYNAGKGLPPLGNGKDSAAAKAAIIRRARELDPTASAASAASDFSADKTSLSHLQQQSDSVMSFVRTFDKNVDILKDSLSKLNSSNSPFVNKSLRWIEENASGDPNYTRFKNALTTVTSEMGKINSGSTGAGGVPISVLEEMQHNLPANATPAQILAALDVARRDSENRKAAMEEQRAAIRGRRDSYGTRKADAAATMSSPGAVPQTSSSPTHYLVSPDGRMRIPAGPDGKPLAGAKAEPNPQPTRVATNG